MFAPEISSCHSRRQYVKRDGRLCSLLHRNQYSSPTISNQCCVPKSATTVHHTKHLLARNLPYCHLATTTVHTQRNSILRSSSLALAASVLLNVFMVLLSIENSANAIFLSCNFRIFCSIVSSIINRLMMTSLVCPRR